MGKSGCCVCAAVNKDITHPRMRRRIENPRIMLYVCTEFSSNSGVNVFERGDSRARVHIFYQFMWSGVWKMDRKQLTSVEDTLKRKYDKLFLSMMGVWRILFAFSMIGVMS